MFRSPEPGSPFPFLCFSFLFPFLSPTPPPPPPCSLTLCTLFHFFSLYLAIRCGPSCQVCRHVKWVISLRPNKAQCPPEKEKYPSTQTCFKKKNKIIIVIYSCPSIYLSLTLLQPCTADDTVSKVFNVGAINMVLWHFCI